MCVYSRGDGGNVTRIDCALGTHLNTVLETRTRSRFRGQTHLPFRTVPFEHLIVSAGLVQRQACLPVRLRVQPVGQKHLLRFTVPPTHWIWRAGLTQR